MTNRLLSNAPTRETDAAPLPSRSLFSQFRHPVPQPSGAGGVQARSGTGLSCRMDRCGAGIPACPDGWSRARSTAADVAAITAIDPGRLGKPGDIQALIKGTSQPGG